MVPSKIKIESFAKRYHMGTLGGKGLMNLHKETPSVRILGLPVIFIYTFIWILIYFLDNYYDFFIKKMWADECEFLYHVIIIISHSIL